MDIFPKSELKTLVEAQTVGCICVSIYMPAYRSGTTDSQQNPVRFKNLLRKAGEGLIKIGLRRPEADEYLAPARKLLDDDFFWRAQLDGLVIFLSKDHFRYFRLPVKFPEQVIVANRFNIKPLLPMLSADGLFYAMGLSQKSLRLFQGTRFGFNELNITGKVPKSMSEALAYDHFDREQQFHHHIGKGVPSLGGMGGKPLIGHGAEVEETKENLLRYFLMVDRGLGRLLLHSETAPLVIVGVDYLFPIYKEANTYKNLLNKEVEGNPDKLTGDELHRLAWSVVEPYFKREQEDALRRYREFVGLGRTTNDLEKIVTESYAGRVYILFVDATQQKWGNFDPYTSTVEVKSKGESCDVDLLDLAAAYTLAHRGTVYAVESDKVPDGGPAVAVLRY